MSKAHFVSCPGNAWLAVAQAVALALLSAPAAQSSDMTDGRWSAALVMGQMTSNGINDVFHPGKVNFADQGFAGVIMGYEVPLDDIRWDIGIEVQANQHFGQDSYRELVVPFTIRYSPARPWPPALDSFAFGLGVSYATETPQIEIATRGVSQRALLYFSLETAFSVSDAGDTVFFRLHHRSDAYGLFATDSGSNAFAVGLRRRF